MALHVSSDLEPSGIPGGSFAKTADLASMGSGVVTLGSLMKPMTALYPAVDGTNGPLTANSGIVVGTPTTTGQTFHPWTESGTFNQQSQNWVAVPTGTGQNTTGVSLCQNAATPRVWTFGNMVTYPVESHHDSGIVTDALKVTLYWNNYTGYSGSAYQDIRVWVEHEGRMKKIQALSGGTALPMQSSGGSGLSYLTLTFKEMIQREIRWILPSQCWFAGAYVDTNAMITRSPNKPLILGNGDSWQDGAIGNVLTFPIGGAYPTGTYRTMGLKECLIEATGFAYAHAAHGGTGEFNCNDGASHPQSYSNAVGESVFHGQARIDWAWTKFGPRWPIPFCIGGWNDGSLGGTPYQTTYQTVVAAGIAKWVAKNSAVKLIYAGIQPVDFVDGDARDLSIAGQAAACAAAPNNVIGFVNLKTMWTDRTNASTGQRYNNVNTTDTIHLHSKGANGVANYLAAKIAPFQIPLSYINAQLAW